MGTSTESRQEKILQEIDGDMEVLKGRIDQEMERVRPLQEEYDALGDLRARVSGGPRRGGRRAGSTPARPNGAARARQGSRKEQLHNIIKAAPGITIGTAAEQMGVQPNYLYRLRTQLEAENAIRKDGAGLFPVEA